jgi:protein-S-isoprenylcysteine O-methyltransferase Ste14
MTIFVAHLIYACAWLSFGLGHSLLASRVAKAHFVPLLGAYYRLVYNGFACLHLGIVWLIGAWAFPQTSTFDPPRVAHVVMLAVSIAGWAMMLISLRSYDLGRLVGTRQVRSYRRGLKEPEDEPLRVGGLHRYVRHPLYLAGFVILWGRVTGHFELATAIWGSAYLIVGARFEERRLLALYGQAYADYRRRVPAFVPWRGRIH